MEKRRWLVFLGWLVVFYIGWTVLVTAGGHWDAVRAHWPIAAAMALGSYAAGSTPMGGGTVGFPVLVLLFDHPGSSGRAFGLAVQSIGMVSASVYILAARRPLDWRLLRPALAGALLGTPLGALVLAPVLPDLWVKLVFSVVWASFGILHLVKVRELSRLQGRGPAGSSLDRTIGLLIGLSGGIVASVTGVGIDMLIYAVLVLLYRTDLKVAIPTSVVLMAFTSVVGIATNAALAQVRSAPGYDIPAAVFPNWLAAAPVVAVGAPFGALVVNRIPRTPTLLVVSVLCLGQLLWTLVSERVSGWALVGAAAGLLVMNALFTVMYVLGRRRHERVPPAAPGPHATTTPVAAADVTPDRTRSAREPT